MPELRTGEKKPAVDTFSGFMLVLFSSALGYLALVTLTALIALRPQWHFSVFDLLFWVAALAIPLAQQRATAKYDASVVGFEQGSSVRRVIAHLIVAAGIWSGAHSVNLV